MNLGQVYARTTGLLYLAEIALAFSANPIWDKVSTGSNAYLMAVQISAAFSPWRAALVNQILALLSSLLMLLHVAVAGTSTLGRIAVLLMSTQNNVASFDPKHLQSLCLLTGIVTALLVPDVNAAIFPALIAPFFLTQLSFALLLAIVGVDVRKWPGTSEFLTAQV